MIHKPSPTPRWSVSSLSLDSSTERMTGSYTVGVCTETAVKFPTPAMAMLDFLALYHPHCYSKEVFMFSLPTLLPPFSTHKLQWGLHLHHSSEDILQQQPPPHSPSSKPNMYSKLWPYLTFWWLLSWMTTFLFELSNIFFLGHHRLWVLLHLTIRFPILCL